MVKIRILAAMIGATLLAGTLFPLAHSAPTASAATTPQVGPGFVLPDSGTNNANAGKYPSVASSWNTVHIAANTNGRATYWSKLDTASSASAPTDFGGTGGDTDYTEAAIATAPNGTVYHVWIVQRSGIAMRTKPAGGDWGETKTIFTTYSFMAYADIAVSSSGQIFVVWNQDYFYRYITSSDGGVSWSEMGVVSSKKPYKPIFIAGGANNTVAAAFGGGDGHAYVAVWNGSSFETADLTPFKASSDFFAFAKPMVAPNGKIYVAWQKAGNGLYYTERQADGTWPVSNLVSGEIYGSPGMAADAENGLHMVWSSKVSGSWQVYYAFKPVSGGWQGPVNASGVSDKIIADVDLVTTTTSRAYAHAVFEAFDGFGGAALRYQQFSGEASGLSAQPAVTLVPNSAKVLITFQNANSSPDSARYHWDAPPTDADAWAAFANPLTIPGPDGVTASACPLHTLYLQLRAGTTLGAATQTAITFDIGVQATVSVRNPHLAGQLPMADTGAAGASSGDTNYTRERYLTLNINGVSDCSHLNSFHIPGSSDSDPNPRAIANDRYTGQVALPQGTGVGDRAVNVEITDKLGNAQTWPFTLTYDPANTDATGTQTNTLGLPVLGGGGSVSADSANSIIRTLHFQGISVTDNLYGQKEQLPPGKQFWGVWIANATADVGADGATLTWYPVRVPMPNSSFTVPWNLFTGLGYTSDLRNKTGDYYVYVRFLDGAGNPTKQALTAKVTLTPEYVIPTVVVPMIIK